MSDSSNTIQLVREDGPVRVAPLARAVGVLQQLSRLDGRDESATASEKAPRMLDHKDNSTDGAGLLARWVDRILA